MATSEVVWYIDARLHRDDHSRRQDGVPLNGHCVMSVHAKIVANMVGIKATHSLNMHKGHDGERERQKKVLIKNINFCHSSAFGKLGRLFWQCVGKYLPGVSASQRACQRERQFLRQKNYNSKIGANYYNIMASCSYM